MVSLCIHTDRCHAVTCRQKLVAAVLTSDINRYREAHRAFVRTLAQKGYDTGCLDIILQTPNPDPISWANTIRKFEALGADIIVTYGAPITLTAMRETQETPSFSWTFTALSRPA